MNLALIQSHLESSNGQSQKDKRDAGKTGQDPFVPLDPGTVLVTLLSEPLAVLPWAVPITIRPMRPL